MRALSLLAAFALAAPLADAQQDLRAWHADGQTFLVWEDDQTFADAESWSIYRAPSPITEVATAELVGRTYPEDARGTRLHKALPGGTWTIPDATGSGTYTLTTAEALFVYTPRAAGAEHFAVVKSGDTLLGPENTAGPVAQTLEPVVPHAQGSGVDAGHPWTLFSVWLDGDADEDAGRPDFPILGPASYRGMPRVFCVFAPPGGPLAGPMPAVFFLHGGGGSYWNYRPSKSADHQFQTGLEDGLLVTFDDNVLARGPSVLPDTTVEVLDRWLGTCRGFDRFAPLDTAPPDDEVVVDFTVRWIEFVHDQLIDVGAVDPARTALMGLSMGGRGATIVARLRPERFSAVTAFVMPVGFGVPPVPMDALMGNLAQNLSTPQGIGVVELMDPSQEVSNAHLPFMRFVDGTTDTQVPWDVKPPLYDALDAQRWGVAIAWDERGHTIDWLGAHFVGSPRHDADWLTRYQRDRSFPALHDVDHLLGAPGQQPDPGDPVVPANGAPWGTWGGWFDWEDGTLEDTPVRWAVTLGLVTGSSFAADNAPASLARASVTVRRPQAFQPKPGQPVTWTLKRASDGGPLARGVVAVDSEGLVTVPDLVFGPEALRLELTAEVARGGLNPL